MNTTSWPTQASVASWASLEGESRSFWATARTWLLELFTSALTRDVEPRCLPSVAFTPSGPLVYQWQIHRSTAQDGVPLSTNGRYIAALHKMESHFVQKVSVAISELKARLQQDYERTYPNLILMRKKQSHGNYHPSLICFCLIWSKHTSSNSISNLPTRNTEMFWCRTFHRNRNPSACLRVSWRIK